MMMMMMMMIMMMMKHRTWIVVEQFRHVHVTALPVESRTDGSTFHADAQTTVLDPVHGAPATLGRTQAMRTHCEQTAASRTLGDGAG